MAQHRFIKYQDPIESFSANEKYAGIIEPSIYRGFDAIQSRSGLNITLNHSTTGELFTRKNGTVTPRRGIWVTKQGVVIKEDANITIPIVANTNNYERWDILVGEHTHDELNPGGLPATYTVIPGTNQTEPSLTSPETQVILGRIRVPANATTSAATTWERRPIPQLGGKLPSLLYEVNRYTEQQQEAQATASINTQSFEVANRRVIPALDGGNSFMVSHTGTQLDLLPNKPNGTEITLTFNNDITIRGYNSQLPNPTSAPAGYAAGFRPILISVESPTFNLPVLRGEAVNLRMVNMGGSHGGTIPALQYWVVTGVTGTDGKVVGIAARLTQAETDINNISNAIGNSTTGLQAIYDMISAHESRTNNPHGVTKSQVGLGNLPNSKSDDPQGDSSDVLATTAATKSLYDMIAAAILPSGVIVAWSGQVPDIPTGWVLCDGDNGTPDLRSKSIVGASAMGTAQSDIQRTSSQVLISENPSVYSVGSSGGTQFHRLLDGQQGSFQFQVDVASSGQGSTNSRLSEIRFRPTAESGAWSVVEELYNSSPRGLRPVRTIRLSHASQSHENRSPYWALAYIMKT